MRDGRMYSIESVGHGIVVPHRRLGTCNLSRVVTGNEIDLVIEETGGHEAANVRHVGARAPGVSPDVVDPGCIAVDTGYGVLAAKYINLTGIRSVDCRGHDRRARHWRQRGPCVTHRIVTSKDVQSGASAKRVATGCEGKRAVRRNGCTVKILRHGRHDLPCWVTSTCRSISEYLEDLVCRRGIPDAGRSPAIVWRAWGLGKAATRISPGRARVRLRSPIRPA